MADEVVSVGAVLVAGVLVDDASAADVVPEFVGSVVGVELVRAVFVADLDSAGALAATGASPNEAFGGVIAGCGASIMVLRT